MNEELVLIAGVKCVSSFAFFQQSSKNSSNVLLQQELYDIFSFLLNSCAVSSLSPSGNVESCFIREGSLHIIKQFKQMIS